MLSQCILKGRLLYSLPLPLPPGFCTPSHINLSQWNSNVVANRGRQCDVRVPTRWRLSLLCYDYCVDTRVQDCVVRCVLRVIGSVMSAACHAEREYPQDGGRGKSLTASIEGFHVTSLQRNLPSHAARAAMLDLTKYGLSHCCLNFIRPNYTIGTIM